MVVSIQHFCYEHPGYPGAAGVILEAIDIFCLYTRFKHMNNKWLGFTGF